MPFSVAAAGIGAAGSIAGGMMQSSNAANAQKQSNWIRQLAVGQSQQSYNQNVQNLAPFAGAGVAAQGAQTDLLGLNGPDAAAAAMANYQTSPGYQWQLGQGLRSVDALGAAGRALPGVRSGATMKAEMAYGQGLANQDFGQYLDRINALAGRGYTAATGLNQASNNLTNAILGVGSSAISGATGEANAQNSIIGNTATGISNSINKLMSDPAAQNALSGIFNNQTVGDYSIPGTSTFGPYGSLFGSPAAGTGGGFNNGVDLVGVGGGITLPPALPVT